MEHLRIFRRGFTLIELLIVVAIISILAVIALPNFEEARIRSRLAVVKNNLRMMSMKIEMGGVDDNTYPLVMGFHGTSIIFPPTELEDYNTPGYDVFGPGSNGTTGGTPTCFMGMFLFNNLPLMLQKIEEGYTWHAMEEQNWRIAHRLAGAWLLTAHGPSQQSFPPMWGRSGTSGDMWNAGTSYDRNERRMFREYDPTNGTISEGFIFRSQANAGGLGVDPWFYCACSDQ